MNINTDSSEQVELGFLLKWILICTVGWIVISAIGIITIASLGNYDIAGYLLFSIAGIICGAIGGISQWLVIRSMRPQLGSWVVAPIWVWSAIISYTLGLFAFPWLSISSAALIVAIAQLALTGFPQWFVLRRYAPKAFWWLIVVPFGIVVSFVAFLLWDALTVYRDVGGEHVLNDIERVIEVGTRDGLIGGVIFGIITAVALAMLLRSTGSQSVSSEQETV